MVDPALMIGIPLFVAFLVPVTTYINSRIPRYLVGVIILFNMILALFLLEQSLSNPVVSHLGGWNPPFGIVLYAGPLGSLLAVVITIVSMLTWIYLPKYMGEGDNEKFYMLYLLLTAGATGMVLTGDIFNLFVFTEITSIASFSLLAYIKGQGEKEAMEATIKYIIIGSISSAFFLIGIALLYGATGTLNMADLAVMLQNADPTIVMVSMMFIITGLGIEAEMFPLNGWTPDAYTGATHPVSAVFAGVVVKAGFYALARIIFSVYNSSLGLSILMVFGVLTLIIGESAALRQRDIKRMLAYSSIGQMGLVITAFAIGTQLSIEGGLMALMNHAFAKVLLFMVVGVIITTLGSRDMNIMKGLGRKSPSLAILFTIGTFAIMGLPFFGGFIAKIMIISASVDSVGIFLAMLILGASVVEAVYFLRVVHSIWLGEPDSDDKILVSPTAVFAMTALAIMVIVMGVYPQIFFQFTGPAAEELLRPLSLGLYGGV